MKMKIINIINYLVHRHRPDYIHYMSCMYECNVSILSRISEVSQINGNSEERSFSNSRSTRRR